MTDRIEQIANLGGTSPDLPVADGMDALAELAQRGIGETEDAANSRSKGADHDFPVVMLTQQDDGNLRMRQVQLADGGEAGFVVVAGIEENDVDTGREREAQDGFGMHGTSGDLEIRTPAQSAG